MELIMGADEEDALLRWLQRSECSPMSREPIDPDYAPNIALRQLIEAWTEATPSLGILEAGLQSVYAHVALMLTGPHECLQHVSSIRLQLIGSDVGHKRPATTSSHHVIPRLLSELWLEGVTLLQCRNMILSPWRLI